MDHNDPNNVLFILGYAEFSEDPNEEPELCEGPINITGNRQKDMKELLEVCKIFKQNR